MHTGDPSLVDPMTRETLLMHCLGFPAMIQFHKSQNQNLKSYPNFPNRKEKHTVEDTVRSLISQPSFHWLQSFSVQIATMKPCIDPIMHIKAVDV